MAHLNKAIYTTYVLYPHRLFGCSGDANRVCQNFLGEYGFVGHGFRPEANLPHVGKVPGHNGVTIKGGEIVRVHNATHPRGLD